MFKSKKSKKKSNKMAEKILGVNQMGLEKQKDVKIDLDNPNF
jgi:hypothetical protein